MRDLEEVLQELKAAEREYAKKCKKYGIVDSQEKPKDDENNVDNN